MSLPISWDESLDSPRVFDGAASFIGGQFSYAKARLLKPDQAILLQDCEMAITGQVSTRFGTVQLGGTLGSTKVDAVAFMNAPSNVYEIAISNGTIYKLNGATWTSIGSLTVSDLPAITQGVNNLYFAAGGDIYSWDGTTLVNISGDGVTQAPRNASMVHWHTNRLLAAGPSIKGLSTDPNPINDAIYFSDLLTPATWSTNKNLTQIRVGAGDGLAITALIPWTNFNIAVFKRRSVWVVMADPTLAISDMPITQIHPTVGCVAKRTAVQVGNDILFLADDGVRSLVQVMGSDQQHELEAPLSFPVQDVIDRINWTAASGACAAFWRSRYFIALPLDGSSTNNFLLVFNTILKSWQGIWTGLSINHFAVRELSGISRLFMGLASTNKVIEYLDYVNPSNWIDSTFQDYTGSTIQPRVITKAFLLGDGLGIKLGIGGELEWNNSKGTITITPILDEVSKSPTIPINVASGGFSTNNVYATDTITSSSTGPANNDTVVVNGRTYTFKTTLTGAVDEIKADGTIDGSLANLGKAINLSGVAGTNYGTGTTINADCVASPVVAHVLTLVSFLTAAGGGSALTLTETSANLTLGAATFTGTITGFNVPFFIGPNGLARSQFDLIQYGEWRELQFDMIGSGAGRKEIRQLSISGIIRPSLVGSS